MVAADLDANVSLTADASEDASTLVRMWLTQHRQDLHRLSIPTTKRTSRSVISANHEMRTDANYLGTFVRGALTTRNLGYTLAAVPLAIATLGLLLAAFGGLAPIDATMIARLGAGLRRCAGGSDDLDHPHGA